ncbi:hypothetical protein J6590_004809 [Homalodisca vitripennis]|nr:hypothetical protein J6590_004809 [Homalodisca vitripennis]
MSFWTYLKRILEWQDRREERTRKERSVVPVRYCRPGSDLARESVPRAPRPQQYVVGSYMPAVDEWEDHSPRKVRCIPVIFTVTGVFMGK